MPSAAKPLTLEMNIPGCRGFSDEWSAGSINVKNLVNFATGKTVRALFFSDRTS
jgi:hypothetical protein